MEKPAWLDLQHALETSGRTEGGLPPALAQHQKTGKTVVFTSLSRLYLPKAQIFAESLKKFHPDWEYHILINDAWPDQAAAPRLPNVDLVVPIRELPIDNLHSWVFSMDAEELCCASRPVYFKELLNAGYEKVFFFDPDIQVFSSLEPLTALLDNHSVLLTPHIDQPAKSDAEILYSELSVLAHGIFNLGFLGVTNNEQGNAVIDFWKHRLTRYSLKEHAKGLWTDQKWFNLVPLYFDGVHVLKHQGCNVASWNISSRPITIRQQTLYSGADPLLFFHFSGFDKGVPKRMFEIFRSYNQALEGLFTAYQKRNAHFVKKTPVAALPWCFGAFDNGEPISWAIRRFYRETLDHRLKYRKPFFVHSSPSFFERIEEAGRDWIEGEYDPPGKLRRYF